MTSSKLKQITGLWVLAAAVACAPPRQGPAEDETAAEVPAEGPTEAPAAQGLAASAPTADGPVVEVQIVEDGECTITASPNEVTLYKSSDRPNSATWKWSGDQLGYDHLYFVLKENDSGLGLCLPSVALPTLDAKTGLRGFAITPDGTNSGDVSPAASCVTGTYPYDMIATKPSGETCTVDPKVKIGD